MAGRSIHRADLMRYSLRVDLSRGNSEAGGEDDRADALVRVGRAPRD
jgi:hypothetical protein